MSDHINPAEEATLADLAHKLVDQVALYGLAKEKAATGHVIDAVQRAKEARAQMLQDINAKIWLRGLSSIDQGLKLGSAAKAFDSLLAATPGDDTALSEVERGEIYLRDRVAKAAANEQVAAHTRNYLQTVVTRIEATLEEIVDLRKAIAARN